MVKYIAIVSTESEELYGFATLDDAMQFLLQYGLQPGSNVAAVRLFVVGDEIPITWQSRVVMWPHIERREELTTHGYGNE